MLGKNRKPLDFLYRLKPVLSQRYGGGSEAGYSKAQIDRTFEEEKLNRRYLTFAYLAFCNNQTIDALDIPETDVESFNELVSPADGSVSIPADGFINIGDAGGFGGDTGGGGV